MYSTIINYSWWSNNENSAQIYNTLIVTLLLLLLLLLIVDCYIWLWWYIRGLVCWYRVQMISYTGDSIHSWWYHYQYCMPAGCDEIRYTNDSLVRRIMCCPMEMIRMIIILVHLPFSLICSCYYTVWWCPVGTDNIVSNFRSGVIPSSNDSNYTIIHSSSLFISSSNVE